MDRYEEGLVNILNKRHTCRELAERAPGCISSRAYFLSGVFPYFYFSLYYHAEARCERTMGSCRVCSTFEAAAYEQIHLDKFSRFNLMAVFRMGGPPWRCNIVSDEKMVERTKGFFVCYRTDFVRQLRHSVHAYGAYGSLNTETGSK